MQIFGPPSGPSIARGRRAGGWAMLMTACVLAAGGPAVRAGTVREPSTAHLQPLHLRTGDVRPTAASDLRSTPAPAASKSTYVIQMDGPLTPQRSQLLIAAGASMSDYVPANAYVARLNGAARQAVAALPFVRWIGRFDPAWKLDPQIGKQTARSPVQRALAARGEVRVIVWSFAGADENAFDAAVSVIGVPAAPMTSMGTHRIALLDVAAQRVAALAAIAEVQFVEEDTPFEPRNDAATWVAQSNMPQVVPLWDNGLHGENQIGGIIDQTLRLTHCAFSDVNPIGPLHRKLVSYYGATSPPQAHGTHTCGTFVGDWRGAGATPCYDGMAFAARTVFRNLNDVGPSTLYAALTGDHNDGARVHTNSYGANGVTTYNTSCVAIDQFSRQFEDDLVVFAVNEVGSQPIMVANPENAKNCLAVAATGRAPSQNSHAFGGTGPTADGRRCPAVMAPGASVISASFAGDCDTYTTGGTSMACPVVAGMGMLVRQYFMQGFYPSGRLNLPDAFTPSGALLKAVLINSAVDLTGVSGYPSGLEGWGRILVDDTLYFAGDSRALWVQDRRNASGLVTSQLNEYQILNLSSAQRLKITLAFTDVEGAVNSSQPVVNNLDLRVIAPDGTIFNGNNFDTVAGQSISGGANDPLNNVEQVHRASPDAGVWTIRVIATAVNGPAADPRQGYALVVSGDIAAPPVASLYFATPAGLPAFVEAGQPTDITIRIQSALDPLAAGSPVMYYRFGGVGSYVSVPLMPLGNNLYRATLPAGACGQTVQYYFAAQNLGGGWFSSPAAAPAATYSSTVASRRVVLDDDFEGDQGWTVTGGAMSGNFERAAPQQTLQCARDVQPGSDHTAGACALCYVTGANGGGDPNANDLDGGPTRLTSPALNLAAFTAATAQMSIWFHDGYLPDDQVTIEVSGDGGTNWTQAAVLRNGRSAWQTVSFRIDTLLTLTSTMRLRISAADAGLDSTMEVLVDDVTVTAWGCGAPQPCVKGDMNQSGSADGDDIPAFIAALDLACPGALSVALRCAGDFDGDLRVTSADAPGFVACLIDPGLCP